MLVPFHSSGRETPTSRGCNACVLWGGKQQRRIQIVHANLAVIWLICDGCPSGRSQAGRAGGIQSIKYSDSPPQKKFSFHPAIGGSSHTRIIDTTLHGIIMKSSPGKTCIGGTAWLATLTHTKIVICSLQIVQSIDTLELLGVSTLPERCWSWNLLSLVFQIQFCQVS